ncbi:MAG: glutamine-hydrolyzing carbamoyl-phosphate synthase small subunit [Candidatus Levybacteria bacterium]|nr:glutamine-hydrolyzing carbamoyl-phosphate synthase small subunit [Candidatus Levybacteria bacterium]
MIGKLVFEDGSIFEGRSFGNNTSVAGELVFQTGMVGYPESLTDPSYAGQILILTYPIIGSYGVPQKKYWESDRIQITGLIVSQYIGTPSHFQSRQTLASWLKENNIPALEITDTRTLAIKLREKGTSLGKIIIKNDVQFYDPNKENLVAKVSLQTAYRVGKGRKKIVLLDCGAKKNIERCLVKRGVEVIVAPWDYDPFAEKEQFDGLVISNGPGDPKMAGRTIQTIKKGLISKIPILGICLGNQLLALAAGGDTGKLKFGHRSHNQPCMMVGSTRCYITTQNHGFAVSKIPKGFSPWFINANDKTNEGIIHQKLPVMSVQFHPEATAGPTDTEWIFDFFLEKAKLL